LLSGLLILTYVFTSRCSPHHDISTVLRLAVRQAFGDDAVRHLLAVFWYFLTDIVVARHYLTLLLFNIPTFT